MKNLCRGASHVFVLDGSVRLVSSITTHRGSQERAAPAFQESLTLGERVWRLVPPSVSGHIWPYWCTPEIKPVFCLNVFRQTPSEETPPDRLRGPTLDSLPWHQRRCPEPCGQCQAEGRDLAGAGGGESGPAGAV